MAALYHFCLLIIFSADIPVCAGCTYTDPNGAIAAANPGDTVTVRAGEVFTTCITLPNKEGSQYVTIRSSRWAELPLSGTRLIPAYEYLMPELNTCAAGTPIVQAGLYHRTVDSVNAGANTITLSSATGVVNGEWIACRINNDPAVGALIMGGVTRSKLYRITGASGAIVSLMDTDGSTVDITSSGTGTQYCTVGKPGHHYKFLGINFKSAVGVTPLYSMALLGTGEEASIEQMPHHFEFDRSLLHGLRGQNGPRQGILANANFVEVRNCYFAHIKQDNDSYGIGLVGASSDWTVRNTYISAASHAMLLGGTGAAVNNRQVQRLKLYGNHFTKDGYMLYDSGAGAPTGACYPGPNNTGRFYRDTTPSPNTCANNACYVCGGSGLSGTWALHTADESVYIATAFNTKSTWESKGCTDCVMEGNLIENGFDGPDSGNVGGILLSQEPAYMPWSGNFNWTIRNNRINNVWRGIIVGSTGDPAFLYENSNITIANNLTTNMTLFPEQSIRSAIGDGASRFAFQQQGNAHDIRWLNNTVRARDATSSWSSFALARVIDNIKIEGNIGPQGTSGIIFDGATGTECSGTAMGLYLDISGGAPYPINGNLMQGTAGGSYTACITDTVITTTVPYVSATDSALQPGSPWSAGCVGGTCQFTAPNGKDMGTDTIENAFATCSAESGVPCTLASVRLKVGSGRAAISWQSSVSGTVKLYTNSARTTLHADTDTGGEQLDSRAGNLVSGQDRTFVLGTNIGLTAATNYYGLLTVGTQVRPFELRTKAAGAGRSVPVIYSTARTGEYSASPDLSSPTAISSAATHVVPVGANAVVWYRETGGKTRVIVEP